LTAESAVRSLGCLSTPLHSTRFATYRLRRVSPALHLGRLFLFASCLRLLLSLLFPLICCVDDQVVAADLFPRSDHTENERFMTALLHACWLNHYSYQGVVNKTEDLRIKSSTIKTTHHSPVNLNKLIAYP